MCENASAAGVGAPDVVKATCPVRGALGGNPLLKGSTDAVLRLHSGHVSVPDDQPCDLVSQPPRNSVECAIIQALQGGDVAGLYTAIKAAVTYLACHARRAHPARDRQTGRSQLGLEPFFEKDDMIECAEAA